MRGRRLGRDRSCSNWFMGRAQLWDIGAQAPPRRARLSASESPCLCPGSRRSRFTWQLQWLRGPSPNTCLLVPGHIEPQRTGLILCERNLQEWDEGTPNSRAVSVRRRSRE